MSTTISFRIGPKLQTLLRGCVEATGKSTSEVVREILARTLGEKPIGDRIGHLRGRLALRRRASIAGAREVKARSWRP